MMRVEVRVGRLGEVRYRSPVNGEELADFTIAIRSIVRAAKKPIVFCTDWRAVTGFPHDVADTIVWIMRRDNPGIESNAILLDGSNQAFNKQVERILNEAGNPMRRAFTDVELLQRHLSALLTPFERDRLLEFLREP